MIPVNFNGSNVVMKAPAGAENVMDVHAFHNRECCVTAWQFTAEEIAEINRTGTLFLTCFMGGSMPPVYIGTESGVRAIVADYGGTFPRQEVKP